MINRKSFIYPILGLSLFFLIGSILFLEKLFFNEISLSILLASWLCFLIVLIYELVPHNRVWLFKRYTSTNSLFLCGVFLLLFTAAYTQFHYLKSKNTIPTTERIRDTVKVEVVQHLILDTIGLKQRIDSVMTAQKQSGTGIHEHSSWTWILIIVALAGIVFFIAWKIKSQTLKATAASTAIASLIMKFVFDSTFSIETKFAFDFTKKDTIKPIITTIIDTCCNSGTVLKKGDTSFVIIKPDTIFLKGISSPVPPYCECPPASPKCSNKCKKKPKK